MLDCLHDDDTNTLSSMRQVMGGGPVLVPSVRRQSNINERGLLPRDNGVVPFSKPQDGVAPTLDLGAE